MAMQKFGDAEQAVVFRGREAEVVNAHIVKHGKAVSEFSDDERAVLDAELEAVREPKSQDETPAPEPVEEQAVEVPEEEPVLLEGRKDKKGRSGRQLSTRKDKQDEDDN